MPYTEIRKFLIARPQPVKVRCMLDDGEDRVVEVPQRERRPWPQVERTILAIDPNAIEALNEEGKTIRAMSLREATEEEAEVKVQEANASCYDRYGMRLVEAFNAGVAASSTQFAHILQAMDAHTQLVDRLVGHLNISIENVHKLAAQVAVLQQAAGSEDDNVAKLLVGAAMGNGGLPIGASAGGTNGSNGSNGGR